MIKRILLESNEADKNILTAKSKPVIVDADSPAYPLSAEDSDTIKNLIDTLNSERTGLGMAANQIGDLKEIFIIKGAEVFINPTITKRAGGYKQSVESCLSRPNKSKRVARAKVIEVMWDDYITGNVKRAKFKGLKAIIIQHEIDHLKGKLI